MPSKLVEKVLPDEVGAHVSNAGGLYHAPARAAALRSTVLQLFTKQAQRWAEPVISAELAVQFRQERERYGIWYAGAHDSYLINLATWDPVLFTRSLHSFQEELQRCTVLGLDALVSHPGNATDGDALSGWQRNADAIDRALTEAPGPVQLLLETTAGSGSSLGASFEQLAQMIERVSDQNRSRVGVCLDTCHTWAAGYDLVRDYQGVFQRFADVIGLDRLRVFHCNDSKGGRGSRLDRHAHIGDGALGRAVFEQLMQDERFQRVPKLIETPKDGDALKADRRNIGRLRRYRSKRAKQ